MTTQAITPSKSTKKRKPWWKRYLLANESVLLGILVLALIILLTIAVPTARQSRIYFDLLREISPNLVAAVGVALLMLAGEFDLSIGAMLALTGVVTVTVFNVTGNMWIGILAGLLMGPLIGSINGYLVTRQKMPSLMTTLGMMFTLRGLVYVYTKKTPIVDEHGFDAFVQLYQGSIGPIPVPGLLALVLIVVAILVTTQTEFGRRIYAIGGNPTAARVSGIQVERSKFWLFVVCSTTAALAGLLIGSTDRHGLLRRRRHGLRTGRHHRGRPGRRQHGRRRGQHPGRDAGRDPPGSDRQGFAAGRRLYHLAVDPHRYHADGGGLSARPAQAVAVAGLSASHIKKRSVADDDP